MRGSRSRQSLQEFLAYLRNLNIEITAEGEQLRFSAPRGRLTAGLKEQVLACKDDLMALLQNKQPDRASVPPVPALPRPGPFPLSFAQQRLWFLEQLEPHQPTYNIAGAYRVRGDLKVPALQHSLAEIVRRHEPLRTVFINQDGEPQQVIRPPGTFSLPVVDLCHPPETERDSVAAQMAAAERQQPFDLSADLMLRAKLLRLAEADHVLVITMHHIASDGWSMGVFWRELTALYQATIAGQPPTLPRLPIQYADYAVWQREWLQGEVLERQLAYWRQQLANLTPLELPTDRPRPAVQSLRGAHQARTMPRPLLDGLEALSRQARGTLFMTLLAAFQTLLFRYTGQTDIAVGAPIAGRTRVETEGLIGCFVNTLVLRTDLAGNPTFLDLLRRVREGCLEAYARQDLPFEKLVEDLKPERTLSQSPLFEVVFAFQNAPRTALTLPGLTLTPVPVESGTAKFDLTLFATPTEAGLETRFEYATALFDPGAIARMLGHFQTLLEGIVAEPDRHIAELPLLTEAERHQLLVEWNDTGADYPQDACIHTLFEAQVERTPDAVAVIHDGQEFTYRELNRRANQLAHALRKRGVGPDSLVGICLERSLDLVVGLLGILKAGGAYLPLDPANPKDRLAFMLAESQASVLLTQARLLEGLPAHRGQVVCLDTGWAAIAQEEQANPGSGVTADNLAYVIYTSGSTGQPKGVTIRHAGLVNLVTWHQRAYGVTASDRAPLLASIGFDASAWELWPYLTAGAVVHIPGEEIRASLPELLEWLKAEQITICFLATPLFEESVDMEWPGLPSLRAVLTGGDRLHWWSKKSLPFEVFNNYGPTEYTVVTTWTVLPTASEDDAEVLPSIGRPIANTEVYVLDGAILPVPIGVPGELYIGGAGLARGYLHRPELTAECFIAHPFSEEPGRRLYRTGDVVRWRPDGTLDFLGRRDNQVKIRGFRVELGEVEAVLSHHPQVQTAVVVAHEAPPRPRHLAAYVVPRPGPAPTASELRRFLMEQLPAYMVPAAFVSLDALPRTPSGKVDRQALPPPEAPPGELAPAYVAPRTPVEEVLAGIWAELFGVDQVGLHDDFFALGGHSLLAVRLFARIHKTFQVDLPLHRLFEAPTVGGLALAVVQYLAGKVEPPELARILDALDGIATPPNTADRITEPMERS